MTTRIQESLNSFIKDFKGVILFDEPMSRHTSFRIGGPSEAIVFPGNEDDLLNIFNFVRRKKVPLFMLGEGTNILVGDRGIRGVVVSLSSKFAGDCFKSIVFVKEDARSVYLYAGAGVALAKLLRYTTEKGLSGLEFTAGIPGSLGGAVIMNAGSYGKEIGEMIDSVRVIDHNARIKELPAKDISFHYRYACIPGVAVLGAVLRLKRGDTEKIRNTIKDNLIRKKNSQPLDKHSAGSVFKNPTGMRAWQLIDSVGLRGTCIGDASISERHPNFIVNNGGAKARDVLSLIRKIGQKVENKTGITLELEVKIVGT